MSGKQCQQWSSNVPHVPNSNFTDDKFPDGSLAVAENFCRNPDSSYSEGVWCYTMDPNVTREACDVPECGKSDFAEGYFKRVHISLDYAEKWACRL